MEKYKINGILKSYDFKKVFVIYFFLIIFFLLNIVLPDGLAHMIFPYLYYYNGYYFVTLKIMFRNSIH